VDGGVHFNIAGLGMKVNCIFATMILKVLLFPFAVLYNLVTAFRNKLFDLGYKPSISFDLPVIGVGNLSVGGTGKTPMIEYLIRLLSPTGKVATLSRGYGRQTKGFRVATQSDTAETLGDEPLQFFRKFGNEVMVAVGEERALAIPLMLQEEEASCILLDDAYQHRQVRPSFQILLSDISRPFYHDHLLPAGRLREARKNASRADVVVMTKCDPNMGFDERSRVKALVSQYTDKPVFFSFVEYGSPVLLRGALVSERIIGCSGIAHPGAFENYLQSKFVLSRSFRFGDHHNFTSDEIKEVVQVAKSADAAVMMTEKDAMRLTPDLLEIFGEVSAAYIPIQMKFLENGAEFDQLILQSVNKFKN